MFSQYFKIPIRNNVLHSSGSEYFRTQIPTSINFKNKIERIDEGYQPLLTKLQTFGDTNLKNQQNYLTRF